jgi:MerR family transcriptional regulator, copper efflux regulator
MPAFTIGQLARQAGVAVETIRFYERRGLLQEPPRRPSGYREYSPESFARLRFILAAKHLGFSLREIRELLEIRDGGGTVCSQIRSHVEAKIATITDQIRYLRHAKDALEALLEQCRANTLSTECPLLEELSRRVESSRGMFGCCDLEESTIPLDSEPCFRV